MPWKPDRGAPRRWVAGGKGSQAVGGNGTVRLREIPLTFIVRTAARPAKHSTREIKNENAMAITHVLDIFSPSSGYVFPLPLPCLRSDLPSQLLFPE